MQGSVVFGFGDIFKDMLVAVTVDHLQDCILEKWLKKRGDRVQKGKPLYRVVCGVLSFEIGSPVTGTLSEIKVAPETRLSKGDVIAYVWPEG